MSDRFPPPAQAPEPDPALLAFIDALPKAELHLHVDGALPWDLLRAENPGLPDPPPFWDPAYRFDDFDQFVDEVAKYGSPWLNSPERYGACLKAMLREAETQNVRYVEASIHMQAALRAAPATVILEALREAAQNFPQIETRLFLGVCRDDGERFAAEIAGALRSDALDGIDLHGHESIPMQDWTPRVWREARDLGKFTKAHAGELGPAAHVRQAIERLDVTRIEHGVRAWEDPELVAILRDRGITLDVCPISNLKLQVVPSIAAHPILGLHRAGVACTVNTDDPFFFGNHLSDDYAALVLEAGLTRSEIVELAANGFRAALVSDATRTQWLDELQAAAR